jgi:hypothetical protein
MNLRRVAMAAGAAAVLFGAGVLVGVVASDDDAARPASTSAETTGAGTTQQQPGTDTVDSTATPDTEPAPAGDGGPATPAGVGEAGTDFATGASRQAGLVLTTAQSSFADGTYTEAFDGEPAEPTPWNPSDWDVTVHSRDIPTWDELEPMDAQHGPACDPPGAPGALVTHRTSSYDGAVFQCRNHMMTAITADGYAAIYLTPDAMVDFSSGTATVKVDVSTLRTSGRDWWDIWITPYDLNVQLPLRDDLPDLNGHPIEGLNVRMDFGSNTFAVSVYRSGIETKYEATMVYDEWLTPDPAKRETFELQLDTDHVRFGMPAYDRWFHDLDIEPLSWSTGIVQLGHHSYTPTKDCSGPCGPNTWHWDNLVISPAVPFTIVRAESRYVGSGGAASVTFASPAPDDAHLRFAGIGDDLEISLDGGATWERAETQQTSKDFADEIFRGYWTPVPSGTTEVMFRGKNWWGGDWRVRDISIWSPVAL